MGRPPSNGIAGRTGNERMARMKRRRELQLDGVFNALHAIRRAGSVRDAREIASQAIEKYADAAKIVIDETP